MSNVVMEKPLISCIVPVFNGKRYLREALDSILSQTYRPLETIVVDDGSTDGTAEVMARYGDWIRYLWQPHAGPAAARNIGLRTARGDFVAFLDADDLWHPEKLARQMARFQSHRQLEVCVTFIRNFWSPELEHQEARAQDHRLTEPVPGYLTQTLMAQRRLFEKVGSFNTSLLHGHAHDWFLRAAEHRVVMELLPDVLVNRRLHKANYSRHVSSSLDAHLRIIKASLDRRRRDGTVPRAYKFPA